MVRKLGLHLTAACFTVPGSRISVLGTYIRQVVRNRVVGQLVVCRDGNTEEFKTRAKSPISKVRKAERANGRKTNQQTRKERRDCDVNGEGSEDEDKEPQGNITGVGSRSYSKLSPSGRCVEGTVRPAFQNSLISSRTRRPGQVLLYFP